MCQYTKYSYCYANEYFYQRGSLLLNILKIYRHGSQVLASQPPLHSIRKTLILMCNVPTFCQCPTLLLPHANMPRCQDSFCKSFHRLMPKKNQSSQSPFILQCSCFVVIIRPQWFRNTLHFVAVVDLWI